MAGVSVSRLRKRYGETVAVRDLSLEVADGEFMALLGPSGCGKTTLLRLIAGLERPDRGEISIGGQIMAGAGVFVEPDRRELGMVFQSYALWPNMSVRQNIEFGLRVRRVPAVERRARVAEALAAVSLTGFEERRPQQLSGGQRQRIALARCLALRPRLILLDEPLANLDAHLRRDMQREFRRIHRQAGTTFIFVTHDQREAMALADRIAVMDKGKLQQIGAPEALYASPGTAMVARFLGGGALLPATVRGLEADGQVGLAVGGATVIARGAPGRGAAWLCVRPEMLELVTAGAGSLDATVVDSTFHGGGYTVELRLAGLDDIVIEAPATAPRPPGAKVGLRIAGGWAVPRDQAA